MRICIVSPHLDDALLSCGILIQRQKALSDDIFILNIFSAGTNSENRKREDQNAAEAIGARPFFLDELDAPDRDPKYKPLEKLFFSPLGDTDLPLIERVAGRVQEFLSQNRIDIAYFPLAAGFHIDHRVTFEAGLRIRKTPVRFYEDRPYILWPGMLQGRMNEIGSNAALPVVTERMMLDTIDSYFYLGYFVPEGHYRRECLPRYFAALHRKSSDVFQAQSEALQATEAELRRLYDCLHLYESQMIHIYPDYDTFVRDSFAHERAHSGKEAYLERSWTLRAR
jgi:LmbE family N-acetylglucosaminyl deacetylase